MVAEHPALDRLTRLDRSRRGDAPRMGYQPTLDGVRAISVVAVILYHAGFSWMHGGFFGVEVFFVVSGFLITSLLVEERDRDGRVDLRHFWIRRWRRLLPALFTMMAAVGVWAVFFGTTEQHTQLRRDFPWGLGYVANWGTVLSKQLYFSGTPTLFRHLWSLAVEEQWYLVWPVVFIAVAGRRAGHRGDDRSLGRTLVLVSVGVMVATAVMHTTSWPTRWYNPFVLQWQQVDTTNFLYLSTITRSSGLLLGAAMAFLWRPWRVRGRARAEAARTLDLTAMVATAVLLVSFVVGEVASASTYLYLLPAVTVSAAVLVGVVVHPWATGTRLVLGWRPLVELGKRSYGLYLWSWPVSRAVGAYEGSWSRCAAAMALTAVLSEACYRFVETPIRTGVLQQWFGRRRTRPGWWTVTACATTSASVIAVALAVFFASVSPVYDPALDTGGDDVVFDAGAVTPVDGTTGAATDPAATIDPASSTSSTVGVPITAARLPRRLVIVGDSTAHSIAINLPTGIESTFTVADGSVEGCSVYSSGTARSTRDGFSRSFEGCADWVQQWVDAARSSGAEVALVVIGAWDVFDVDVDGVAVPFASEAGDARFLAGLQQGIDALAAAGVKVALLEVPCMRPQDVTGAGVPALPERGDDTRVAHVNELLRQAAASNAATTTFVPGPQEYCTDPTIAADLAYRWDGVHAYKPGANLTFQAIAGALLAIPV
ncbi:MAG: acyltransferase family protein [Ilumatobacteraceae bacterium]